MKLDQRSLNIILAHVDDKDVDRLALQLAQAIISRAYETQKLCKFDIPSWSETCALALAIRNILWEVKEHGELQTHPEDLLEHATCNFRCYECRGYPGFLKLLCRAFAGQLCNFQLLPHRKFDGSHDPCGRWRIFDDGHAARSDYSARRFIVKTVYSHDEFGNHKEFLGYYVCESLYGLFDCRREGDIRPDYVIIDELFKVVPFEKKDEANFFIACLVELLNTGYKTKKDGCFFMSDRTKDDYIHQAAAQLIRDTLTQAPIEEIRMREEREAAERAAQLEKERREREKQEQLAAQKRKRLENMRTGVHVYILQLDNDTCKIGVSDNVTRRIAEIEEGGLDVLKFTCTEQGFLKRRAEEIESACHEFFRDKRKQRIKRRHCEYFHIFFDEACDKLKEFAEIFPPMDRDEI